MAYFKAHFFTFSISWCKNGRNKYDG